MKPILISLSLMLCSIASAAQSQSPDEILREGTLLYRSEMASWNGSDIFFEKCKNLQDQVGGYFSYGAQALTYCIFFTKDQDPKVLCSIAFDSTYDVNTAQVALEQRNFTQEESKIYAIRQQALTAVQKDPIFKTYKNTSLNIVPVVSNDVRKVYVLTGPKTTGVVVFGNDYLLTFDEQNRLTGTKKLHKNIIPINYGKETDNAITMHTHLPATGDYITPTDICTLMLYGKYAKWKQHYVISKNYVSIWDCEKNLLATPTKKAWDQMNEQKSK
ncbi:MAG TPA: hypothetical protein VGD35_11120 [Chitinophaga sp.]